jgi:hypothetical protein
MAVAPAIAPTIAAATTDEGAAIAVAISIAIAIPIAIAVTIRITWIADAVGIPGPVAIGVSANHDSWRDIATIGWFRGDGAP